MGSSNSRSPRTVSIENPGGLIKITSAAAKRIMHNGVNVPNDGPAQSTTDQYLTNEESEEAKNADEEYFQQKLLFLQILQNKEQEIQEKQFQETYDSVESLIEGDGSHRHSQNISPCVEQENNVVSCYKINSGMVLRCRQEVKDFQKCVESEIRRSYF